MQKLSMTEMAYLIKAVRHAMESMQEAMNSDADDTVKAIAWHAEGMYGGILRKLETAYTADKRIEIMRGK